MADYKYYSETKVIKLKTHPRNFCEEDLVVNLDSFVKEKFRIFEGIVIEIFPVDERKSSERRNHLLLEVRKIPPDVQAKGGPLSISQEVAQAFNLSGLREVCIRRVDKDKVALDLVEFRFKDQGLSRSDMWRFTNSLIDKGMYISRKLLFAGMLLKVSGLWARGDTVKSGVVTDSTRIVFRSASSQFFLFIQVSSEIWEFDPNGDTYFDKAVDGFLKDLFSIWKEKECNHQVTLVFFARKYFRQCNDGMLTDTRGCYYTDHYYVVIQDESRPDWSSVIVEVKKCFQCFQEMLCPQPQSIIDDDPVTEGAPDEWISTSAEGNILEATNLAVNALENHYKNCNFYTTGQQIVIVSPGAGVFEVDSELNRLTKERVIDQGVGVDLICLNEQPLHAVPLFKFYSGYYPEDHYYIPHWINYSYYNPSRPWTQFRYQPRIKISDQLVNKYLKVGTAGPQTATDVSPLLSSSDPLALIDYDTYDANIFAFSGSSKHHSFTEDMSTDGPKLGRHNSDYFEMTSYEEPSQSPSEALKTSIHGRKRPQRARHYSDNYEDETFEDSIFRVGSAEMISTSLLSGRPHFKPTGRRRKAFINPFDPSKSHVEANSHHCRWMHTFPRDCQGRAFQTHHMKGLEKLDEDSELKTKGRVGKSPSSLSNTPTNDVLSLSLGDASDCIVVENFASVRRSGMDWTSLTEPACLPLTTDYFPDNHTLNRDYVVYNSSLIVNNDETEGSQSKGVSEGWRADHQNIDTIQAFKEMISQRLAQGFQLVFTYGSLYGLHKDLDGIKTKRKKPKIVKVRFSLGRVFHNISLEYPHLKTHMYKMKTPIGLKEFTYKYKLITSRDSAASDSSGVISHMGRENYNWNYLDQHVCGHAEFEQYQESHKYWRCRFLVLPSTPPPDDRASQSLMSWLNEVTSGFIRLVELMNNIKRTPTMTGQKKEFGRLNSMPSRSSSVHSSAHTSPCPSPTPSFSRQRSRDEPATPLRSNSDGRRPSSGDERTRSRDDLRSPGARSPSSHEWSRSPQLSLLSSNSVSQRGSREVLGDLKELTFGRYRSTSPNPQRQRLRLRTGSTENLPTAHEEDTAAPSLRIVPSTPTRIPSNDDDDLSPLDFPDAPLMLASPPEKITHALMDRNDGVDLLVNQPPLRNNCFISMEAIKWLQEKMDGSPSRKDIVTMMQDILKKGFIVHASGDKKVPFIDGFYFYYIPETSSSSEDFDIDYDAFRKKWFEIGINSVKQETNATPPSNSSSFQNSPYYMHSNDYDKVSSDGTNHFVEFNPDQQSISDRPEWCYIHYKNMYYQTQGYPLEFQWMACTLSLLHKLVQSWTHKAAMCGFNLVPVDSLGTLGLVDSTIDQPHPFLHSLILALQLPPRYQALLNDSEGDHSVFLTNLFQFILDKLGFLLDPTSLTELESSEYYMKPCLSTLLTGVFIHHSGVAIVQPVVDASQLGFRWLANNYYLQQKSTSQSVLNKYDEVLDAFETLIANTDELGIICDKANEKC